MWMWINVLPAGLVRKNARRRWIANTMQALEKERQSMSSMPRLCHWSTRLIRRPVSGSRNPVPVGFVKRCVTLVPLILMIPRRSTKSTLALWFWRQALNRLIPRKPRSGVTVFNPMSSRRCSWSAICRLPVQRRFPRWKSLRQRILFFRLLYVCHQGSGYRQRPCSRPVSDHFLYGYAHPWQGIWALPGTG